MVTRPWSSFRFSCGERLLLRCNWKAGNGTLISSYEVETGLLFMLAGPLVILSSGDGYVGELLELQQGCEGPFPSSSGKV